MADTHTFFKCLVTVAENYMFVLQHFTNVELLYNYNSESDMYNKGAFIIYDSGEGTAMSSYYILILIE